MDPAENIFQRELELENCDVILTFLQKKVGDVSCVVWDAALVLAKYLDLTNQKDKWLQDRKVLELGAGVGCAGLTAACFGAHVIVTDLENVLPLLMKNVETNEKQWKNAGGIVEAQVLEWGGEVDIKFKPDLILLADCIYYEQSIEPLLNTLQSLLCKGGEKAFAILSQEERDTPKQVAVWKSFLTALKSKFRIENIPTEQQHTIYSSPDIHLMKIFLK